MKTISLFYSDCTAPDYENRLPVLSESIGFLIKNGMVKNLTISYDESKEHEIKAFIEKTGLVMFDEDEITFK